MKFEQQLYNRTKAEIWETYCGFLNYTMEEFMNVQTRLMEEQIDLWSKSPVGKSILRGKNPKTIDDFRKMVPITTYDDYADVLLAKRKDSAPLNPVVWLQTTWEGGKHPMKVAPYSRSMLDTYRKNVMACFILAASTKKGDFDIDFEDKMLYGLAPLPFATGLLPLLIKEEINLKFLPEPEETKTLTFSEKNKLGFKLAMRQDVEFFFGLGSVVYAVSQSLIESSKGSGGSLLGYPVRRLLQLYKAKRTSKKEKRPIYPKDLFNLKGFMVAGTDNRYYKDDLEKLWGIRPMEIFAGTEPSLIGTETWCRNGLYFFPNAAFYEFIKEEDYMRLLDEPTFQPNTYLIDEVVPGTKYEIVVTVFKGSAFARYRVGDIYECVGLSSVADETVIPRFRYIDRTLDIIDIGGFTRISKFSIEQAMAHSKVKVVNWIARKQITDTNRPYMKVYAEFDQKYLIDNPMSTTVLKELLITYFKYIDQDYKDLKKILGMEPVDIELLPKDSFKKYEKKYGKSIRKMNASQHDLINLLKLAERR